MNYYEFDHVKLEKDLREILCEISRKAKILGRDEQTPRPVGRVMLTAQIEAPLKVNSTVVKPISQTGKETPRAPKPMSQTGKPAVAKPLPVAKLLPTVKPGPVAKPASQTGIPILKPASQTGVSMTSKPASQTGVSMTPKPASVTGAVAALNSPPAVSAPPSSGKWYRAWLPGEASHESEK